MSKIDEAAEVIRQLQAALGLHVSMVASGEQPSHESTSTKLEAQKRAKQWLDSIELPEQVREWPQYMQRVWIEKEEMHERAKKCSEFIGHSPLFAALPSGDQELLKEQCEAMWQYFEIIGHRVARFINASSKGGSPPLLNSGPQEPEAVTVSVTMAPGAEPLSDEKFKELDKYLDVCLQKQIKRRGSPKLFNVQDSDRPAFVIAHTFEEALSKWKVAVAEENATDSEYEEVPPAGIMHVCDGDELIIDRGFADKANS
jgi:hypothetical protein